MKRPAVGLTIGYDERRQGLYSLRQDYVRSIEAAGGLPFILAPGKPEDAPAFLERVACLVLSGGSDVDPELFGQKPHPKLGQVVRERDDFELALCREALQKDLPMLAICRGQQVLNVATGGTLIQDIPSEVSGGVEHDPRRQRWQSAHLVHILQGTRLRGILGRETVAVNSFHHQAVDALGKGLAVSARSDGDELVEAVEMKDRRFVVGVQWHPESYWDRPEGFASLFDALVAASR